MKRSFHIKIKITRWQARWKKWHFRVGPSFALYTAANIMAKSNYLASPRSHSWVHRQRFDENQNSVQVTFSETITSDRARFRGVIKKRQTDGRFFLRKRLTGVYETRCGRTFALGIMTERREMKERLRTNSRNRRAAETRRMSSAARKQNWQATRCSMPALCWPMEMTCPATRFTQWRNTLLPFLILNAYSLQAVTDWLTPAGFIHIAWDFYVCAASAHFFFASQQPSNVS
jgi:hypothetical protein